MTRVKGRSEKDLSFLKFLQLVILGVVFSFSFFLGGWCFLNPIASHVVET